MADIEVVYKMPKKGANAQARFRPYFFDIIVLKGSILAEPEAPKMKLHHKKARKKLLEKGVVERTNGQLVFMCDHLFNHVSLAASVIEGGSRDGFRVWRDKDGKTLSERGFPK